MRWVVILALLASFGVLSATPTAVAGDRDRQALIGPWEGTVSQEGRWARARLTFSDEDDQITWTWSWYTAAGLGRAEGVVSKFQPPAVELRGQYVVHPASLIEGSPITMLLTIVGHSIEGTGVSDAVNRAFSVSVTKR